MGKRNQRMPDDFDEDEFLLFMQEEGDGGSRVDDYEMDELRLFRREEGEHHGAARGNPSRDKDRGTDWRFDSGSAFPAFHASGTTAGPKRPDQTDAELREQSAKAKERYKKALERSVKAKERYKIAQERAAKAQERYKRALERSVESRERYKARLQKTLASQRPLYERLKEKQLSGDPLSVDENDLLRGYEDMIRRLEQYT